MHRQMKMALLKAGIQPSPEFRLELKLVRWNRLVKKGKYNEANILQGQISEFCKKHKLKLPVVNAD